MVKRKVAWPKPSHNTTEVQSGVNPTSATMSSQVHNLDVGCIYAPDKVNPNIFHFYFYFSDIFHHTSMHPPFCDFYEFYLIFNDLFHLLLSTKITSTWGHTFFLILFGAGFANTFPCIMPGVEIRAVYEITVSHALEQGICMLNHTIPASPPQCLTVIEQVSLLLFLNNNLLIKM